MASAQRLLVSIDEHAVARFIRKFLIPKGFHTIRNKKMRVEKLFFSFDTGLRTLLDLVVTPGNARLAPIASKILAALRTRYRRTPLRVVLDAGAANNHRELLQVVDQNPNQVLLARTPRRTAYLKHWKALPEKLFTPTRSRAATRAPAPSASTWPKPPPPFALTGTPPSVMSAPSSRAKWGEKARTGGMPSSSSATTPPRLSPSSRSFALASTKSRPTAFCSMMPSVDAAPSGYSKHSADPDRPGFRNNALMLYSWLAGLAVNALGHFTASLPERFCRARPRTLRRWWLHFPAELYLSDKALFVLLHPRWFRDWWQHHIEHLNSKKLRIPWLADRLVLYSLEAPPPQSEEPSSDPSDGT
ncbi:hypothetical protein [Hyalangium sp.]|uniref:hypothetical protein n=1 Tax=Hyalangium sp. TaxID=2028555 RepID=UPI002D3F192A|nr:hypothetical protein [Hyalangium sp.]HYH96878.1 hypothetical protein [Hyalangium sp.]